MDEQLRLHPLNGFMSSFEVLCTIAERKGWKVLIELVGPEGHAIAHDVLEHQLAFGRVLQVVLVGHGFRIRERERPGFASLNELARGLLDRVEV